MTSSRDGLEADTIEIVQTVQGARSDDRSRTLSEDAAGREGAGRQRQHDQALGGFGDDPGGADGREAPPDPVLRGPPAGAGAGIPGGESRGAVGSGARRARRSGEDGPVALLERLLREGEAAESRTFIHSLYNSGWGAVALADDLIRPVMERIGHGWMVGSLDVYQEHEATQIVAAALRDLVDRVGREQRGRPAGPGGDHRGRSVRAGRAARRAGAPGARLARSATSASTCRCDRWRTPRSDHRPRLIFVSVSYLKDEDQFVREYRSFHESAAAVGAAVIVGGQALGPELRSRLIFASHGDRMAHLAEFARRLSPPEESPRAGGSGT